MYNGKRLLLEIVGTEDVHTENPEMGKVIKMENGNIGITGAQ